MINWSLKTVLKKQEKRGDCLDALGREERIGECEESELSRKMEN